MRYPLGGVVDGEAGDVRHVSRLADGHDLVLVLGGDREAVRSGRSRLIPRVHDERLREDPDAGGGGIQAARRRERLDANAAGARRAELRGEDVVQGERGVRGHGHDHLRGGAVVAERVVRGVERRLRKKVHVDLDGERVRIHDAEGRDVVVASSGHLGRRDDPLRRGGGVREEGCRQQRDRGEGQGAKGLEVHRGFPLSATLVPADSRQTQECGRKFSPPRRSDAAPPGLSEDTGRRLRHNGAGRRASSRREGRASRRVESRGSPPRREAPAPRREARARSVFLRRATRGEEGGPRRPPELSRRWGRAPSREVPGATRRAPRAGRRASTRRRGPPEPNAPSRAAGRIPGSRGRERRSSRKEKPRARRRGARRRAPARGRDTSAVISRTSVRRERPARKKNAREDGSKGARTSSARAPRAAPYARAAARSALPIPVPSVCRLHVEREEEKRVFADRGRGRADQAALLIHGHERALRVRGARVRKIRVRGDLAGPGGADRDRRRLPRGHPDGR